MPVSDIRLISSTFSYETSQRLHSISKMVKLSFDGKAQLNFYFYLKTCNGHPQSDNFHNCEWPPTIFTRKTLNTTHRLLNSAIRDASKMTNNNKEWINNVRMLGCVCSVYQQKETMIELPTINNL
ncbi:hypothetical protein LSH36_330g09046 [Paralvinella palmiformis]|uniref:Uncharacterized protein n=1 Tax=Paralvinella palmiformis TaxID=53620 RepID=A0AAD9JFX2_9ANNE|nr:hypothetical protein LSH36_330g09046 [Paralvinella palmiformis]